MSYFDDASLVMIPSGYKTSKVYSVKPTSGDGDLTFTRSNDTATRVNSAGLIEKVRTNFVLQSNQFDTTWTSINTTETIGAADFDGGNNAWTLAKSASSAKLNQNVSGLPALSCFSVYAKAGTLGQMAIETANRFATFNLSTGVVVSGGGVIESVGGGWYRCSVTDTVASTGFTIYPAPLGDTSGNIIIYKAQIEAGDIATDYIPTTSAAVSVGPVANVPRLDYLNSSCPRLLLEPQRQNAFTFSEAFDNAAWIKTDTAVTANTTISPDGYQNADTMTTTAGTSRLIGNILTGAGTFTISCYVKRLTGDDNFQFRLVVDGANQAQIFAVTNEWQRLTFTVTAASSVTSPQLRSSGDGTGTFAIWGAQFEQGAYATSYIPTLGAAVTRGADAASKTGISSLIGQTEGTLFVEMNINKRANLGGSGPNGLEIKDASGSNVIMIGTVYGINQTFNLGLRNAGSFSTLFSTTNNALGTYKLAAAYSSAGFVFYVNGVQIGTTATLPPSATYADIGLSQVFGSNNVQGELVNQALLFKTRLTNAQLAELTTL